LIVESKMESASSFGFLLWKTGGSLVVVLTLLLAIAYGVKRWGLYARSPAGSMITILARQTLGPKHNLMLVQVQGELLLLAVSPEGIKLLRSLEKAAPPTESAPVTKDRPEDGKTFGAILERLTKKTLSEARREC
jgi:flagellar biosynthetic protein FliO